MADTDGDPDVYTDDEDQETVVQQQQPRQRALGWRPLNEELLPQSNKKADGNPVDYFGRRNLGYSGSIPPPSEDTGKNPEGGGKRKSKGNSKKVSKKPVVSQKKQSIYKEIFGKQMKIYKMPDSRKEYVKYKGELLHISDYKDLMKQKAMAKTKTKTKATQQKAIAKTKAKK